MSATTKTTYRTPTLPAAARRLGATLKSCVARGVYAVSAPLANMEAVFGTLSKLPVTWPSRDPSLAIIIDLRG